MFPTQAAKRLVSIPRRAGTAIRQRLSSNGQEGPRDNILANFEAKTANLVRAAGEWHQAKADLDNSDQRRSQAVSSCQAAADQAIASLNQAQGPSDGGD